MQQGYLTDQMIKSNENQFITFQVGDEEYGVDILQVQEIIRYMEPTKIPNSPKMIKGVINFRGEIIPVIDMRKRLELPERKYDHFSVIIVLEVETRIMGIVVDQISGLTAFTDEEVQETSHLSTGLKAEFVKGLGNHNGQLIILLNVAQVLSFEEQQMVEHLLEEDDHESERI